jgi:serine/threonine protein kinase
VTHLLSQGQIVAGRYEIEAFVGEGGMQEVYKSIDRSLARYVALKVPKNKSAIKRFQRSAAMSAKVTHPNVAKTFDYIIEGESQYLVEEFCAGMDLKSRLDNHFVNLDPHLAAHLFHHFIKGLAAVHKVGVLHRDLKPSNVMVSSDPGISEVKITDFGVAKMAESEIEEGLKDDESTLASNTVVGALPYMAPEMIKNSKLATLSADVWSAGAMLYQLLTGNLPFGGGIPAVSNILSGVAPAKPPLLNSRPTLSQLADDLWSIVIACLRSDPGARPTAAELVKICEQLCYSSATRSLGVISNYGQNAGDWGFIGSPSAGNGVFFHVSSFWGSKPKLDDRVSFAMFVGSPSPRAHPVLLLR